MDHLTNSDESFVATDLVSFAEAVPPKGLGAFSRASLEGGKVLLDELPLLCVVSTSTRVRCCSHCCRWIGGSDNSIQNATESISLESLLDDVCPDWRCSGPSSSSLPISVAKRASLGFCLPSDPVRDPETQFWFCSQSCVDEANKLVPIGVWAAASKNASGVLRAALQSVPLASEEKELIQDSIELAVRWWLSQPNNDALRIAAANWQSCPWSQLHRQTALTEQVALGLVRKLADGLPPLNAGDQRLQFDRLLGCVQLNATRVCLKCPLLDYFRALKDHAKVHELDSVQPILRKLRHRNTVFPVVRGLAIFSAHHHWNHSCQPNCVAGDLPGASSRAFGPARISIRTITSVPINTELCINYCCTSDPELSSDSLKKELKRCFGFDCQCRICSHHI